MLKMEELRPFIDEAFENGNTFSFPINGTSMKPLLHTGDVVKIKDIKDHTIKKGDILLYVRDNGQYVIHRVRYVYNDTYDIVGDHQVLLEYGVRYSQIIAYAVSYKKKGKEHEYFFKGFRYSIYKLLVKSKFIRKIFSKF
ncbi:MAG: S24/S26 family peptidase [Anaeroplasmataceae bacterium]